MSNAITKKIIQFDEDLANEIGLEEAIMVVQFQKHIMETKKYKHEGRFWIYQTLEDLEDMFPYWTLRQIRRILVSLKNSGVIITGAFNESKTERTRWYAFYNEKRFLPEIKKTAS